MDVVGKIQGILKKENIDAWMIISEDGSDKYYEKYVAKDIVTLSVAVYTKEKASVFVHLLDKEVAEAKIENMDIISFSRNGENTLGKVLVDFLINNNVNTIALNYTTMNDVAVDTLGHGQYKYFTNLLINKIKNISEDSFVSSERIIYSLIDSKSESQIEKMKIAANRALDILKIAFSNIKTGMSEIEVAQLTHNITEETRTQFLKQYDGEILSENYSWEKDSCPIVLTGKSFLKGGHATSGNSIIKGGNTVYFDFGVKLTFKNGESFSSDIQRTGYVLNQGETDVPDEIKRRFTDVINAITVGIENMQNGVLGKQIDKVVRGYLVSRGYPNYDHATGHAIGEFAHNPGTDLIDTGNTDSTGNLRLQPNGTYTIEPRIPIENGVSIEEMVVVRENKGAEALCERQMNVILIGQEREQ